MARNPLDTLPEVFRSTTKTSAMVSQALKKRTIRKIGPRLYTKNTEDPPEVVISRNLWQTISLLCPNTVVAHRTALEAKPTADGVVYLSGPYTRKMELPGLTIQQIKGPGRLLGDRRFVEDLWFASRGRAYLENLMPTKKRSPTPRTLERKELERRLEGILRASGADALNNLREEAANVAPDLQAEKALGKLNDIMGTLLGSRNARLGDASALARSLGHPYDPARLEIFQKLLSELVAHEAVSRPSDCHQADCAINLAFFDAYFSNYIEGTEFEVDEAKEIIFENKIPTQRPADAHDILGTFRVLTDRVVMRSSAAEFSDADEFIRNLKQRHATILHARLDNNPGEFKTEANFAGGTAFVTPELVDGTLRKGYEIFRALMDPFSRAAFMMFLVAEVHPFADGNGRTARIMMNVELESANETHILIPTVYRDDYLSALRALSRERFPRPLVQMLAYAQRFTALIDFADYDGALTMLTQSNAFEHHRSMRLLLPG